MELKSITSVINLALIRGEGEIRIENGEYNVGSAFLSVTRDNAVIDGSGSVLSGNSNLVEISKAKNVKFSSFNFVSSCEKDFAVRINSAQDVVFENCSFSSKAGCVVISDGAEILFKNCEFSGNEGNGICIMNASNVKIENCNFALALGDGITVADNRDGFVVIHNNSFKRCKEGIRSFGRNTLKITNNYFLTYFSALCFSPSLSQASEEGTHKAEIRYNLFDDCCVDGGEATVVVLGAKNEYSHREITITENIFSQKERAVINAVGVNYLIFKENNVHTNGESTVENSIINGIKA